MINDYPVLPSEDSGVFGEYSLIAGVGFFEISLKRPVSEIDFMMEPQVAHLRIEYEPHKQC